MKPGVGSLEAVSVAAASESHLAMAAWCFPTSSRTPSRYPQLSMPWVASPQSVQLSLEHLRTFPWIAERERAGSLTLHGAWFDISLGELHALAGNEWLPQPCDQAG